MTCARPIRNAHPMPSPELIVPNPPLPDSRVVTPEDLRTYMQRYTEELLGPIGAWMADTEMAWKSVFRNTPDVGPLEIDNDSASPYIGMVRDPAWPMFGTLQDEVDTLTTTLDGIVDDIEALETCCTSNTACCNDLTDRVEALEAAVGPLGVCCYCNGGTIDCADNMTEDDCTALSGTWQDNSGTITSAECPDPVPITCANIVSCVVTCHGGNVPGASC